MIFVNLELFYRMEAEVHARRREISASLAHEEATLAAIQDSLKSADQMTKTMESILENFGERLGKLEEAVIPIHRQTKDLQRLQDNIENVLGAIDNVRVFTIEGNFEGRNFIESKMTIFCYGKIFQNP